MAFIELSKLSLETSGGEALFQRHLKDIAVAFEQQDDGLRVEGAATVTLKVKIMREASGLRIKTTAESKIPGFIAMAVNGRMDGDDFEVVMDAEQLPLPGHRRDPQRAVRDFRSHIAELEAAGFKVTAVGPTSVKAEDEGQAH